MTDMEDSVFDAEGFAVVSKAVGESTISWNTISWMIFRAFHLLSGMYEKEAKAAFFCVKSDRSQRDIVTELVKAKLEPIDKRLANKMISAIGQINSLAAKRNDVQHVVLLDVDKPSQARLFHDIGFLKGKEGPELLALIKGLSIDCAKLARELALLQREIVLLYGQEIGKISPETYIEILAQKAGELPIQRAYDLLVAPAKNPPSPETGD